LKLYDAGTAVVVAARTFGGHTFPSVRERAFLRGAQWQAAQNTLKMQKLVKALKDIEELPSLTIADPESVMWEQVSIARAALQEIEENV